MTLTHYNLVDLLPDKIHESTLLLDLLIQEPDVGCVFHMLCYCVFTLRKMLRKDHL